MRCPETYSNNNNAPLWVLRVHHVNCYQVVWAELHALFTCVRGKVNAEQPRSATSYNYKVYNGQPENERVKMCSVAHMYREGYVDGVRIGTTWDNFMWTEEVRLGSVKHTGLATSHVIGHTQYSYP